MATPSDSPFDPIANPTWNDVLAETVVSFPGQIYSPILDTLKQDSSVIIDPFLVPAQIGAVWGNTVDTYMRVSWPAIVSILTGAGGNTFLALTDVDPASYAGEAGSLIVVNAAPDGLEFTSSIVSARVLDGVTDGDGTKRFFTDDELEETVETREPAVTGSLTWATPGMSVFDPTTVRFEAGTGVAIAKTGLTVTSRTDITWAQQDIVVSSISSRAVTFFTVDSGGTVQQYVASPSRTVLDTEPFLGIAIHDGSVIDRVIPFPRIAADQGQLLFDAINAAGGVQISAGGEVDEKASFQAIRRLTELFAPGLNFTDSAKPNDKPFSEADPMIWDAVFQDGTTDATGVSTFIKSYESAPGVLTALSAQQAVIHKIILIADGTHQVQYGNVNYTNFSTAKNALAHDLLENPVNPLASAIGVLLAVAIINNPASDWTIDAAEIIQLGRGGGGNGNSATPALGELTDVTLSAPTEGQVISFDGTTDWVNGHHKAQFLFTFDGNVAPASDVGHRAFTFATKYFPIEVRIDVKTAPTSTALQVDVLKNGTTIFAGGGPIIGIGTFTQTKTTLTPNFVPDDEIRINIDTGDSVWKDLTVHLRGNTIAG